MSFRFAALFAGMFLLAGCSSFHKEWKQSLHRPVPQNDMSGPWEGRWLSSKNGHTGRLRCIMTSSATNVYQARFHATFWKIFRAGYRVPFAVTHSENGFQFTGKSDLGKLGGGVYSYQGTATGSEFRSTYESKYDRGTFEMSRPNTEILK